MTKLTENRSIRIIPLGGLGEVGKNMMVFEYGDDIVIIDCGIMFPREFSPGVDLIIPNIDYLRKKKANIRGILVTHGHEDHIGALPFILREIPAPVYAPQLAASFIESKLREHGLLNTVELHSVFPGDVIPLNSFEAEFFQVCHSIPDACGIALHTPSGVLVHTGDFKIDHTPVDGKQFDFHRLAELGQDGVLLLLSDSTYAEEKGYTPSEQVVGTALDHAIVDADGRVLVATFASLIARIQQVIDAAINHGRKVAIVGRSMTNNVKLGMEKGYLTVPSNTILPLHEIQKLPLNQQVIITTGSQGEPTSALVRIASGRRRQIKILEDDTVIISASAIPGNETTINLTIDNLNRQGAHVLHSRTSLVHVHGHASQEELKTMLGLTKPKYFVPIHGEYRMLVAHGQLAGNMGIEQERIFVLEDGDVLEIGEHRARIIDTIDAGHIYIDGLRQFDRESLIVRDRLDLGSHGFIAVIFKIDQNKHTLIGAPQIITSGVMDEQKNLEMTHSLSLLLRESPELGPDNRTNPEAVASIIRKLVSAYVYKEIKRRPMIIPVPIEV